MEMDFRPGEFGTYSLRRGDVLLSEASGSPDQVGKPVIWNEEIERCCFQNTVIRLRPTLLDSRYMLIVFKHFYHNGIFAKVATGVGINHLSGRRFGTLAIPVPPAAEQQELISTVEERLSVIEQLGTAMRLQLLRSPQVRQSILKRAFEGRLVPQDPSEEPAQALLERIREARQSRPASGRSRRVRRKSGRKRPQRELFE